MVPVIIRTVTLDAIAKQYQPVVKKEENDFQFQKNYYGCKMDNKQEHKTNVNPIRVKPTYLLSCIIKCGEGMTHLNNTT